MHQNWMRDYDPTTGRYLQADPLGLIDGASVYSYALQNPGRYTDPRGEFAVAFIPWIWGVITGGVTTAGATGVSATGVAIGVGVFTIANPTGAADATRGKENEGEDFLMCPDPCGKAREKVREAKKQHTRIGGSARYKASDSTVTLLSKHLKWRQECSALREVRRLCPSATDPNPLTHFGELSGACANATQCAALMR